MLLLYISRYNCKETFLHVPQQNEQDSQIKRHARLQKHNAHASALLHIRKVFLVDTTRNRRSAVIEEIVVQLPVTGAELQLLEEKRVVLERESVEDVEMSLEKHISARCGRI